jgi:amino acid efflux transporter
MSARTAGGTIGPVRAAALYIAAVLGSGIFVLPSLSVRAAGPAALIAVGAVFLFSIPLASTFAALSIAYPDAGGVATFTRMAFGGTAARMAGYWFFFGVSTGAPIVAVLGAQYVTALLGASPGAVVPVAVLLLVPSFAFNLVGLRLAASAQLALTAALLATVLLVCLVATGAAQPTNLRPFLPHGWAGVGEAVSLNVWAFTGWEAVTHLAGDFRRPRVTVPIATAAALIAVGTAYLGLQWATVAVLGARAGNVPVPLLDILGARNAQAARMAVGLVAVVVVVGVLNTYVGAFAKLGAALGRDGDLPRGMRRGAEAGDVPRVALAVVAALMLVDFSVLLLVRLDLEPLILLQTSCMVAVYVAAVLSAVRLLPRRSTGRRIAALSLVLTVGLVILAGIHLALAVALAVAALGVTLARRWRPHRDAAAPSPAVRSDHGA